MPHRGAPPASVSSNGPPLMALQHECVGIVAFIPNTVRGPSVCALWEVSSLPTIPPPNPLVYIYGVDV